MDKPMIECIDVGKIYDKHNQVRNIHLQVQKGECLALCGGNGAGKSTIIKMIVGLLTPSSGEIFLAGHSHRGERKTYLRQFGYMPDAMLFPKTLTGYEVLSYFAKLRNLPADRAEDVLERVGLAQDGQKKISHYSKGMQQRLSLGQALLANPAILILDEPTNGLDPLWVIRFKQFIQELKEAGTTILLSSHIMRDVEEMADRVAFIHGGQLIHTGAAQGERLEDVFFRIVQNVES